jgi:hypothetical protein
MAVLLATVSGACGSFDDSSCVGSEDCGEVDGLGGLGESEGSGDVGDIDDAVGPGDVEASAPAGDDATIDGDGDGDEDVRLVVRASTEDQAGMEGRPEPEDESDDTADPDADPQTEVTSAPGVTSTTEVASAPGVTSTTEVTSAPGATSAPEVTEQPDGTAAPQGGSQGANATERADLVFGWTAQSKPTAGTRLGEFRSIDFWKPGINCGGSNEQEHAQSTRVTFGVNTHARFPGERSVEFFTDRSFPAACNQHLVSHRAEMNVNNNASVNNHFARYRQGAGGRIENSPSLGIETGSPGSVLWLGWSELYADIDPLHTTTLWQLRSNCGTGSPAVALAYRPDNPHGKGVGIYLLTQGSGGNPADNYTFLAPLSSNGWRDFSMEIGYSRENRSGFVKVWHAAASSGARTEFDYDNPSAYRQSATLFGSDAPLPSNANNVDDCPHLRWGLYRHDGSAVAPEQITEANRVMTKYMSSVRVLVGGGLGQSGLDAVVPRPVNP